jgi:transposase
MSLPEFSTQIELFGLQLRRDRLFGERDRYRLFAERIYPILLRMRGRLAELYCQDNGRPAVEPVLVLGVSLLQFMERLPDRQAQEHLKYHVGWKYALGQELEGAVFDSTVLVRFRQRLVKHGQERMLFEEVLAALEDAGLLTKRASKQRLDSTHVLGLVSRMSSLDCIREALRLALEELAGLLREPKPDFWEALWERYVESEVNYQSPAEVLQGKRIQAGEDAQTLIDWLRQQKEPGGPKTEVLKRVFGEYYEIQSGAAAPRQEILAKSVQNPHDPEASFRQKRDKKWVGYVMQAAETVEDKGPGFITAMVTQTAVGSDEAGMTQVLAEQAAMGFEKPKQLYVDAAYISAEALAEAHREQRELLGPAVSARKPKEGTSVEAFAIDLEKGQAICPAGETNTQLSRIEDRTHGILEYRFEWSWKCHECAIRNACLGVHQKNHRTVRVNSNFMHLQARRALMKTETFQEKMKKRAGIEGTLSEIVRGYGARRARYRGLAKLRLQNYFIGAACNVNRWFRRLNEGFRHFLRCAPVQVAYA